MPDTIRGFRIPDDLYAAAKIKAERQGVALSDVVREALRLFLRGADWLE